MADLNANTAAEEEAPDTIKVPDTVRQAGAEEEHRAILADEKQPVTLRAGEKSAEEQEPVTLRTGAQGAVKESRESLGTTLGASLSEEVAKVVPTPEQGELSPELTKLSKEKVTAWLDKYQDNLRSALVDMFKLDPKFSMTDDELALFLDELKDPAHIQQKTFFTLTDWIERVKRENQISDVDESTVVDHILSDIVNNEPPASELRLGNAA
jgi:hypothetical protein